MQTIVLSNSVHETYAWADAQGRHRRTVRHIPAATSIQGRAYDGIVELPSFADRRDRHAVLAAVKKLKRAMPKIPHTVDEDWVNPPRKKRVEKSLLQPTLFLFANAPVEAPLGDIYFASVAQEAEEDFSIPEDDTGALFDESTPIPGAVTVEMTEEIANLTAADVHRITIEADASQAIPEESQAKLDSKPKRKGRRTNEQKAFDEAFQAYGEAPTEENSKALTETRAALRKRHPDDERLEGDLPDLDF